MSEKLSAKIIIVTTSIALVSLLFGFAIYNENLSLKKEITQINNPVSVFGYDADGPKGIIIEGRFGSYPKYAVKLDLESGFIEVNEYRGITIEVRNSYRIETLEPIFVAPPKMLTLSDNFNITIASLDAFGVDYEIIWYKEGPQ